MTPEMQQEIVEKCQALFGFEGKPRWVIHATPTTHCFPILKKKGEPVDYKLGWELYGELAAKAKSEQELVVPEGYELLELQYGTEKHEGIAFPVGYVKELNILLIQCKDRL